MNPKILITGGAGMVGSQANFGQQLTRQDLDIENTASIHAALEKHKPDVLVHLAGLVDMKACEEFPERAYAANVLGTLNLAIACKERGIHFVYLSTCTIFDGEKASPYMESDLPAPLNVYARTKWLGEVAAQDICQDSLIIRTGWLFGGGDADKKFIRQFIKKLKSGLDVVATSDRYGSPTYIPDLLLKIEELIRNKEKGIIHAVNKGCASYYEVAKKIKNLGGFSGNIKATPAAEIESINLPRAKMEALDSERISMRPWEEALADYLKIL